MSVKVSLGVGRTQAKSGSEFLHNRHRLKSKITGTVVVQIEGQTRIKITIWYIRTVVWRLWSLCLEIKTEINARLWVGVPKLTIVSLEACNPIGPRRNFLEVHSLGFTPAEIEVKAHKVSHRILPQISQVPGKRG